MKKRNYLFLYVLLGFVACTGEEFKNEVIDNDKSRSNLYNPNHRSYAEAVEIAQNSIKMLKNGSSLTRGTEPARTLNLKAGVKAVRQTVTRSNGSVYDNDTLLYIFNFNNNRGFAVVSAYRQTDGLVAVIESGSYDPEIATGNPAFDNYMRMAKAYVAHESRKSVKAEIGETRSQEPPRMYKPLYDTVFYQNIEPRISVRWGQEGRVGQYCPNYISGCVNTAVAQAMTYFQYPASITLTYPERDVNSTALNWTDICNRILTGHTFNIDETDKQIGRLARQLGHLAGSNYQPDYTETTMSGERDAIQSLGYNVSPITDYDYIINNFVTDPDAGYPLAYQLGEGKLLIMGGHNSDDEGHMWVIDGCYYVKCKYYLMVSYDGGLTWSVDHLMATYRTCHNHINWGYSGRQNGFFNNNVFNVYNVLQEDPGTYHLPSGYNLDFYDNVKYFAIWH